MIERTIPYGRQNIEQDDIDAVIQVLKSDFLTQGPAVAEFERAFANYVGAKYAVAVSNGTTALHLAAIALGVKEGTRVITTPITFVASSNCVLYCGGEVEFVDINEENFCLDPNLLEDKLKKNPGKYAGVIPVDFAGHPVKMDDFRTLSKKYGFWIIEDACHAPGGSFTDSSGQKVFCGDGKYADIGIFSFHPVKHIACGEGGMITTNDEKLYRELTLYRTHGITKDAAAMSRVDGPWFYEQQVLGFNYRIPDMLCALGLSQLKKADKGLMRRRAIAERYDRELAGLPLTLPKVERGVQHAYHLYVVRTEKRGELFEHLKANKVYPQVHYIPVHQQPYYVSRYGKQSFPVAEKFYSTCLSLPMFPGMTDEEQGHVIKTVRKFYDK